MILAFPTDTCYGLACNVHDESGFRRIFELKQRSDNKPLSIAVRDFEELKRVSTLSDDQIEFLKQYPFPFTILTQIDSSFKLPHFLNGDVYRFLGIRVASVFLDKSTIDSLVFPVFLTSANISGEREMHSADDVVVIFQDKVDRIIRGKTQEQPTSNIFRFVGNSLELDFLRRNY